MISIVAVDNNWGIGKNNGMPWKIPGEQLFFKEKTFGGIVIMGRKTLESLPGGKPLKGRENIVLTRNKGFHTAGVTTVYSLEELLALLHGKDSGRVFIIGGAQIYKLLIPYCKEAFVTKIKGDYDVDTYHPDLDSDSDWCIAEISPDVVSSNGIIYNRYFYENKFFIG